jgi:hypothetical protein
VSSLKTGVSFAFYQKKVSVLKQAYFRDMFEKASKSVYTSTVMVYPNPASTSSTLKTPANT